MVGSRTKLITSSNLKRENSSTFDAENSAPNQYSPSSHKNAPPIVLCQMLLQKSIISHDNPSPASFYNALSSRKGKLDSLRRIERENVIVEAIFRAIFLARRKFILPHTARVRIAVYEGRGQATAISCSFFRKEIFLFFNIRSSVYAIWH